MSMLKRRDQSRKKFLWDSIYSVVAFREQCLTRIKAKYDLLAKQNQSPDNPKTQMVICNTNYLSKNELIFLCLLLYLINGISEEQKIEEEWSAWLRYELLMTLPEKVMKAKYLSPEERICLQVLIQKNFVKEVSILPERPFSQRSIFGLLLNPQIQRKVLRRLFNRKRPNKVRRSQRVRGYRDQGTLRPSHNWLPESDYSLTEEHNRLEEDQEEAEMLLDFSQSYEAIDFFRHLQEVLDRKKRDSKGECPS